MKTPGFRRYLVCVIALLAAAHLTIMNSAFARAPHSADGAQAPVEYSAEELESLRAKLLNVTDAVKDMAGLLQDNTQSLERLEGLRAQLEQLSAKDLTTLRKAMDPSVIDTANVSQAHQILAAHTNGQSFPASKRHKDKSGDVGPLSAGLPVPPFQTVCSNLRVSADEMNAALLVYLIAESVAISAKDACLQTAVVLGEGGNTSLACLISDGIFGVAKGVWATLEFCDDNFTKLMVDTSYARLANIHSDLESSVTNDNNNTLSIKSNDNLNAITLLSKSDSISASIKANTDSNAASIISALNNKAAAITGNADTNRATILSAISDAASSINGGATTSQNQVRDLILDTQIEADLARDLSL